MHEASIVCELLDLAVRRAPAGARIARISVRVGLLTGVSPDALQFYFEALREEAVGNQAELDARLIPLRGACGECAAPFEVGQTIWSCPTCGGTRLQFENGDELDLESVVIEDAEPDHDRTEDPQEERGYRR